MAEDRIDDIVSPRAIKQLDDLDAKLVTTQKQLVDSLEAALKFNAALSGSKSLKDLELNSAKAEKALLGVQKAQAQTELVELRLQEARNRIAAKREAQINKEIALEEKKQKTIISNSQAEIEASNASATGNTKMTGTLNARNKAQSEAANSATALTKSTSTLVTNTNTATISMDRAQKSIDQLKIKLESYRAIAAKATDTRVLADYNGRIQQTERQITQLTNVGKKGFDEFGNAIKTSGNFAQRTFGVVRQLAYLIPGLGIAGIFALAIDPIVALIKNLDLFSTKLSKSATEAKTLGQAFASTEYTSAVKNVSELAINIDLAQQGLLRKDDVLKQYNDTIGKTTGQVSSLDEAEKALVKNGPAFIQMQLLKAAAQLALDEAAKKAFEAEQERQRRTNEGARGSDLVQQLEGVPLLTRLKVAFQQNNDALREFNQTRVKEAEKGAESYLDVAEKFQKEAADIGKQFQGGLFGSAQDQDKAIKARIAKELAAAEKLRKQQEEDQKKSDAMQAKYSQDIAELDAKYLNNALERLDKESKEEIRQIINANEQVLALAEQSANEQNLILADQFSKGIITAEEYAQKRVEIQRKLTVDTINEEIAGLEFLIKKQQEFGFSTEDNEKKIAELKQRLSKETTAAQITDLEKLAEREKEISDKRKELSREVANLGIAIVQGSFERASELLTKESEQIDIRKAKDIEAAENSIMSEQDKANRITIISAKAQAQKEAIERRQRQLDLSRARFERAANIANIIGSTAAAVAKALPNIPLSILVGAIGAVQLATAVAAPLPKFKDGGTMKKTGPAEFGHGTELRIDPDGKVSFTKSTPEVGIVQAGTRFISNKDLKRSMAKQDPIVYAGGQEIDLREVVDATEKSRKDIVGAILSQNRQQRGIGYYSTAKGRGYLGRNI